ncbi:MAG TPA: dihydroorotate dehydrogenase-like protein [Vicinamibacterales bacterium]|nr:dihydroorotate dehydrogenase-like protein [Vicinamibacterales bacterium]
MTLTTSYMGLTLAHPFVMGASPLTGHLDSVRRLEDAGCAAIVMHSLFEEQIGRAAPRTVVPDWRREFANSRAFFPRPEKFPLDPADYLEQIRLIKSAVTVPVLASLNGTGIDGWLRYVPLVEQAGADALELNVYYLSTGLQDTAAAVEAEVEELVRSVKELVRIPVSVKLSPFYTAFANLAMRLDEAGTDGLVLFNRFYQADIDIETLEVVPNVRLSTSADLLLRLRWLAALSGRVRASLAATGGVHTVIDGIKALLAGAHAVQIVSAVLEYGPQHFRAMEQGLRYWMHHHEYDSIEAFRGQSNLTRCSDPAHFERASYLRVLQGWRG